MQTSHDGSNSPTLKIVSSKGSEAEDKLPFLRWRWVYANDAGREAYVTSLAAQCCAEGQQNFSRKDLRRIAKHFQLPWSRFLELSALGQSANPIHDAGKKWRASFTPRRQSPRLFPNNDLASLRGVTPIQEYSWRLHHHIGGMEHAILGLATWASYGLQTYSYEQLKKEVNQSGKTWEEFLWFAEYGNEDNRNCYVEHDIAEDWEARNCGRSPDDFLSTNLGIEQVEAAEEALTEGMMRH